MSKFDVNANLFENIENEMLVTLIKFYFVYIKKILLSQWPCKNMLLLVQSKHPIS